MKNLKLWMIAAVVSTLFTQCQKDDLLKDTAGDISDQQELKKGVPGSAFTVTVENISEVYDYFDAGATYIPEGASGPGPAFPGQSFVVEFHAGKGHLLSFASMYGASNDLFYAPDGSGIELFDGDTPLTGNITDLVSLWDAGTEVNHAPGSGEDGAEENISIMQVRNTDEVMDGFDYNDVEENIEVWLEYDGTSMFTLTIKVLETSGTPLSPVAWVVHSAMQHPIFQHGETDYGVGLEALAETGNAGPLSEYLAAHSGYVSPLSPGVWVVHKKGEKPIFKEDKPDYGEGLEALAETGNPAMLYESLSTSGYNTGVFSVPEGKEDAAPLFPGESYTFSFEARVGEYLSFASMLGKSNDEFLAPGDMGIRLFEGVTPITGEVTGYVMLWDAGTEINEYPGAGIHQGAGETLEHENVTYPDDGYSWPDAASVLKVTVSAN